MWTIPVFIILSELNIKLFNNFSECIFLNDINIYLNGMEYKNDYKMLNIYLNDMEYKTIIN